MSRNNVVNGQFRLQKTSLRQILLVVYRQSPPARWRGNGQRICRSETRCCSTCSRSSWRCAGRSRWHKLCSRAGCEWAERDSPRGPSLPSWWCRWLRWSFAWCGNRKHKVRLCWAPCPPVDGEERIVLTDWQSQCRFWNSFKNSYLYRKGSWKNSYQEYDRICDHQCNPKAIKVTVEPHV